MGGGGGERGKDGGRSRERSDEKRECNSVHLL